MRTLRILALAVLVLASTWAYQPLAVPAIWWIPTATTVLAAGLTLAALRRLTDSILIPTLGATVLAAVIIHSWFASDLSLVPNGPTLQYLVTLGRQALTDIETTVPPVLDSDGIGLLITSGATLAFLLAELVGVGCRAPVWAMMPLLALWTVPVLLSAPVAIIPLLVTAAAFLMFLALVALSEDRNGAPTARGRVMLWPATIAEVSIGTALALVVAPALSATPNPIHIDSPAAVGWSQSTRLELGLDLREELLRPDDSLTATYTGISPEQLGPLHAYTATDFNGSTWDRSREDPGPGENAGDAILHPGGTAERATAGIPGTSIQMEVLNLQQDRLLIPGEPRSVVVDATTQYFPEHDELSVNQGGDLEYAVTIYPRDLTAERLRTLDPRSIDADPAWLAIPETGYSDDIAEVAEQVIDDAGAQTGYDQALALQHYFRSGSEFLYTESVAPAQTPDAVWDFLQDKSGYCVQFASAMVVMARSLGLPTRLAIGYLPGERDGDVGVIGSHSAHAWPQILFPEVGWVRFEPTPQIQTGSPPPWAPDERTSAEPNPTTEPTESTPTPEPSSAQSSETAEPANAGSAARAAAATQRQRGLAITALLLIAVAAGAALWFRRREQMGARDAETAWEYLTRRLHAEGLPLGPQTTPHVVARDGASLLDADAAAALAEFADAIQAYRYRSNALAPTAERTAQWVRRINVGLKAARQSHTRTSP